MPKCQASKTQRLTPRQYAVLRTVWSLNTEERAWLDRYFRISEPDAYGFITTHKANETLYYEGQTFEIEVLHPHDYSDLVMHNGSCKISFRLNRANNFAVALVKLEKQS
jgi:hypothetical protein